MSDLRLDSIIVDWLREGPEAGPERGLERALAATRPIRQRPAWAFPRSVAAIPDGGRPMVTSPRPGGSSSRP